MSAIAALPTSSIPSSCSLLNGASSPVPCISTNCKSGPNEILLNGRGGFLVKNNNTLELYKKMVFCIKNYNLSLRKNKISKQFLGRFLMSKQVKKYENLLIKFENK